ncbi:ATPase, T2SS/T4P/T4SS family [Bacillus velezensis]
MDIGERRKPQNGSLSLPLPTETVHLRMSTLPTMNDESLVIRLLPKRQIPLWINCLYFGGGRRTIVLSEAFARPASVYRTDRIWKNDHPLLACQLCKKAFQPSGLSRLKTP